MNRLRDQYDWAVLGDSPGALLSAGLAAKLGLSVIVLPFFPSVKLSISKTGQYLDPEPNFSIGLAKIEKDSGLVFESLSRMGLMPSEISKIRKDSALPQVLTPEHRLAFGFENDQFVSELERELGKKASERLGLVGALAKAEAPVEAFWKSLPDRLTMLNTKRAKSDEPKSFEELRRRIEKKIRGAKQEQWWFNPRKSSSDIAKISGVFDCLELCRGLNYGIGGADQHDPVMSELLHTLILGRTGASYAGGMTAYRDLLLRIARRIGAHVPEKTASRRIFVEDGRIVGIQIANKASVIGVKGAILGCSLSHTKEQISSSGRKWFRRLKKAPKPIGWRFTIAVTVRAEAISPAAQSRLVWQEEGAPVLEIEMADPADYGSTEPGHRWIFLRTVMPFTEESIRVNKLRMTAARMLRQLSEIMPFLEYHIVKIYPDFREENQELSEVFGFSSIDWIPDNLRCYAGEGIGCNSGIEGMMVASGESYPALGSFGQTVAAMEATAWIAHKCGLAGPFA